MHYHLPPTTYHQRGIVAIGTVLVIFASALALAASVQLLGIGELQSGFGEEQSEHAFQAADSCMDEALLRLTRNNAYTGATLSLSGASCTIVVTGSGGTRTIDVSGTFGSAVRKITADVTLSGDDVAFTSWVENTN